MTRRLAAILAADVVGYSRMMSEDEAGTLAELKNSRADIVEPAIAKHRGRIVKFMGDGILADFDSVVEAVECAAEIQREIGLRYRALPTSRQMLLRIGVHLGDVIVEGDDVYGDGVNIAARLEGLAETGGVHISRQVFDQVDGKLALQFRALGPQQLKNIPKPVEIFAVELDGDAGAAKDIASAKQDIKYCRAADGVRLAYSMMDRGRYWSKRPTG